jgi:hypothetical protein
MRVMAGTCHFEQVRDVENDRSRGLKNLRRATGFNFDSPISIGIVIDLAGSMPAVNFMCALS